MDQGNFAAKEVVWRIQNNIAAPSQLSKIGVSENHRQKVLKFSQMLTVSKITVFFYAFPN